MQTCNDFVPETLSYLPAHFRGEIARDKKHHPITWLLEAFESNVHVAERIIEKSSMLFDPEEMALFASKVRSPMLSAKDLVDLPSLVGKLLEPQDKDKVSRFLRQQLSNQERDALSDFSVSGADTRAREWLVFALNRIILGPPIDEGDRFIGVRFSGRTRRLRALKTNRDRQAMLNRRLLEDAYPGEILALPETPILDAVGWEPTWARWLASLIYLDLDQEWVDTTEPAEIQEAAKEQRQRAGPPRLAKAASTIKRMPALYRKRGTPAGLTELLQKVHGWDLEIAERSWPKGMEIGISCTIGGDTWLMDDLDGERQFTVLVKPTESNLARLGLSGLPTVAGRLEFDLVGQARGRRIESLMVAKGSPGETAIQLPMSPDATAGIAAAMTKLHQLIDSEKPAHTRYYIALEALGGLPEKPALPPLIIELDSIIEHFWLN